MRVDDEQRISVDAKRYLCQLSGNGVVQLSAHRHICGSSFRGVGIDRGFQRRAVGRAFGLQPQSHAFATLDGSHHPLAGFEMTPHRLADLISGEQDYRTSHQRDQERCCHKGDPEHPDQQARRPPLHGVSSTGRLRDTLVVSPAITVTDTMRSPTRSCQPATVYVPTGTWGRTNVPSASGVAKYG